ncbi:MAG: cation diffusion facilitator family transporter [Clostridia bacterium]|nr:cation diffusion facilitator family transporter [Clostridia bacterium]
MTRARKGFLIGVAGTFCNLLLAVTKIIIGMLSGSIAIQTDAVNNLGDVLSTSAVAVSFLISGKKADKQHPYGHGRLEYVVSFAIAIIIIVIAIEFVITSVKRIISPLPVTFSWPFFAVIAAGIVIKLGMGIFYHISNKSLASPTLRASEIDSFQDVLISSVTLVSFAVSRFTAVPLDAIFALSIAALIFINGIRLVKSTMDTIIGGRSDRFLNSKIMSFIMTQPNIIGAHDLMLHDYGPNRSIASVHAEVPSSLSLNDAHRIIDEIERNVLSEFNIDLVVHIDPVDMDDKVSRSYKLAFRKKLQELNPALGFHDFRVDKTLKTIFIDIVIPFELDIDEEHILAELKKLDFGEFCFECIIDYQ